MRYNQFPNLNRYLRFESHDDYMRYQSGMVRWPDEIADTITGFKRLLDSKPAEGKIHTFLESHPYLLPGFGDLHHGPFEGIIATKLALGNSFVSDFAYVASNSQTLTFTCVEIESGRKKLFRSDEKLHRDYLDARQQISDWLFWAKQNTKQALSCWGSLLTAGLTSAYDISFRGFLVFGRRSELDSRVKQERWSAEAASLNPSLQTMTYDRLLQKKSRLFYDVDNERLAVCSFRDRRFIVKSVIT